METTVGPCNSVRYWECPLIESPLSSFSKAKCTLDKSQYNNYHTIVCQKQFCTSYCTCGSIIRELLGEGKFEKVM